MEKEHDVPSGHLNEMHEVYRTAIYPNKLGMKFLSRRFNASEADIKEGLDALVRNYEYKPYTVTEELTTIPYEDLLSFYGDRIAGIGSIFAFPVGLGYTDYSIIKAVNKKNKRMEKFKNIKNKCGY